MKKQHVYISFMKSYFSAITLLFSSLLLISPSMIHAAEGDLVWAKSVGGTLDDIGQNIFVDLDENVYTTGYFNDTVDFDPGPGNFPLTSEGNADIFISKLDRSGNLIWAKNIGGAFDDEGYGIFVDSMGNVYTTGYFQGTVDFDPNGGGENLSSEGSSDIFISKLDSNGNFVDAWALGGTADDYGFGIFLDPSGNIYTTGYFKNTLYFNPGGVNTNLSSASMNVEDIFISKLNSNGTFAWAKGIGGTNADVGLGISAFSSGNVYITGWFQGSVDFDRDNTHAGNTDILISNNVSYDIFVTKLNSGGNYVWAKAMGGSSEDIGQAVAVDRLGNVYTTGWFNGTADFDPASGTSFNLVNTGIASDIFVSKLNSNGNFLWAKAMGGVSSADVGFGIAVDGTGNVYTTGSFQGTVDFDPGTGTFNLTSAGNEDIFISKLYSNGDFAWVKGIGGNSVDYGYDVFVDRLGAVYTIGYFQGTADFDPGSGTYNLISNGFEDIFIHKLAGRDPFPWNLYLPAIIAGKPNQQ